jgi:hypothetical protein
VDELEALAAEGLNSGEPFEAGAGYWEEKHRRLDDMLREKSPQPGRCRRTAGSSLGMTVFRYREKN